MLLLHRKGISLSLVFFAVLLALVTRAAAQVPAAPAPCPSCPDSIARENQQPGSAGWNLHAPAANHEIEGFAGANSVNRGGQITFYVNTTSPSYTIQFFRLGWYHGLGAHQLTSAITLAGQVQPACTVDAATYLLQCPWHASYTLTVPSSNTASPVWITGVYVAKIRTTDTFKDNWILFVVRDDAITSDLLFNVPVATHEAYNSWGGKSLYTSNSTNSIAATKVSFDRPQATWGGGGFFIRFGLKSLRYLEKNGFNLSYATDVDLHEGLVNLANYKAFVSGDHNEYWSRAMRTALETARDAGMHVALFNANTMEWQCRFEPNTLNGALDRTMVEYRTASLDPDYANQTLWPVVTTKWRSSPVTDSEQKFVGSEYLADVYPNVAGYTVEDGASWVFSGTGLTAASTIPNVIGREINAYDLASPAPPGPVDILATGNITTAKGTAEHADMTLYQAPSGANVFTAGTLLWPFTLDNYEFTGGQPDYTNPIAQQITNNVLQHAGAPTHFISLTLSSPVGGEVWPVGSTQKIQWTYAGLTSNVKLVLYKAGVVYSTIASSIPIGTNGVGSFSWKVPTTLPPASDYAIRISSLTTPALLDHPATPFTIAFLAMQSPNGGEFWPRGSTQNIRWTYFGLTGNVKIVLYKAGVLNSIIATSVPIGTGGAGSFTWTVPGSLPSGSDYTVRISTQSSPLVVKFSLASFSIGP